MLQIFSRRANTVAFGHAIARYKLYEVCEGAGEGASSVTGPVVWVPLEISVLGHSQLRNAQSWREDLFMISTASANAFDVVEPDIIGNTLLDREPSCFSSAAFARENIWMCVVVLV